MLEDQNLRERVIKGQKERLQDFTMQKMEERLMRAKVNPSSIFLRKTLGRLELAAKIGVDVIAIRRGKRWIIDPENDEMIVEGDILIVRGAPLGVKKLAGLANGTIKKFR